MSRLTTKSTKYVRPAKTQISLGKCPLWSESSLSAWRKLRSLAIQWVPSEDSDQPGWSESSLGEQIILLVLSWGGSYGKTTLFTFELPHDKTNKMTVRPTKTQISLGIRPIWSESLLCTHWVAKDPNFLHADSKDSDQTGQMPRLIWVFTGRTCHFVGFVMRRSF